LGAITNDTDFSSKHYKQTGNMKSKSINISLLITLLLIAGIGAGCNNEQGEKQIPGDVVYIPESAEGENDPSSLPEITFENTIHDFGKVIQGEIVTYAYKFTNTGKKDLLIANVSASCGCTATKYPKQPIAPGESDYIKVTFNSSGRKGFQNKSVNVSANTQPANNQIFVRAQVITPEK
jgi:hypothetical protein